MLKKETIEIRKEARKKKTGLKMNLPGLEERKQSQLIIISD